MEAAPYILENQKRELLLKKAQLLDIIKDINSKTKSIPHPFYAELGKVEFKLYLIERKINASIKNSIEE